MRVSEKLACVGQFLRNWHDNTWIEFANKLGRANESREPMYLALDSRDLIPAYQPVFLTTYRGLSTAAAPRSLALNRSTTSLLNSASLPMGAWVTVIGQFSM